MTNKPDQQLSKPNKKGGRPDKRGRWATLLALAVIAALGLWAFWIEPASLRVAAYRLELADWPASLAGLRVAVVADIHVGSPYKDVDTLDDLVDRTNATNPDLILLAGDYLISDVLGGTYRGPEEFSQTLGRLHAPMGVYAVLGNHDWWEDAPGVIAAFRDVGIPVLRNQGQLLRGGKGELLLFGLGDFTTGHSDLDALDKALAQHRPMLIFTHNPDVFPLIPQYSGLVVAAHTHGGQVWLPIFGRLIVPSRYGQRYAIGHIRENGRDLFVSPGIGTSITPVRFAVPPEISLLTIEPQFQAAHQSSGDGD